MKLELDAIRKSYGKCKALRGVSATLEDGVYGLLGPNGAGKTTLIKILIGILSPSGGTIRLDGKDTAKMGRSYFDLIGYMPQYPQFYANFTVQEFLSYMCRLKGVKDVGSCIEEALVFVNLYDRRQMRIGALSGGMRQRLGIAQAILNDPKLLVLDEPTAGLDPGERIRFRNLLSKLATGRSILLATHIVSDVECIAKEILLLQKGQLVMQGTPSQLEQSIQGKVWEMTVNRPDGVLLSDSYCVSNMKQQGENFQLRIISDTRPLPGAVPVSPNLDDVFLHTFFRHSEGWT
ncbi:MAG: ABC transporter ATP-binding protein [Lachnospiraceae bacterium]|nr:ABC transporter ATP-binding protein [Lachnospiraceae bacterium]